VFPKPARPWVDAIRKGETRVKGSRGIGSETLDREDAIGEKSDFLTFLVKSASRELCKREAAGSNIHNSHLSRVAAVNPCK
jgi:hypothetical protein